MTRSQRSKGAWASRSGRIAAALVVASVAAIPCGHAQPRASAAAQHAATAGAEKAGLAARTTPAAASQSAAPAASAAHGDSDHADAGTANEVDAPSPSGFAPITPPKPLPNLPPRALAWHQSDLPAIRGVTVGPIESALHPGKGYGSEPYRRTLRDVRRMGGNWVSLTPFGRVWDLAPSGVSLSFEAPYEENRRAVARAVEQAHAAGLRVLLVPHLWVETGEWRALIDPGDDTEWQRWAEGYGRFLLAWARLASETGVDMLSLGVELRSWVTTTRAPSFSQLIARVRAVYPGLLTYAANWDDVDRTVILGELDVIGINAFYPLADEKGANLAQLMQGGERVAADLHKLAQSWNKPVMFSEFGYTTREDPAVRPWEWPDHMKSVQVSQLAQAQAYYALLAPLVDEPWFAGFFVWRVYADPHDMSQEAEWGFSPRGKLAELVLRDAFAAHWAADGPRPLGAPLYRHRARRIGLY